MKPPQRLEPRRALRALAGVAYRSGAIAGASRVAAAIDRFVARAPALERLRRGAVIYVFHRVSSDATPFRQGVSVARLTEFCELLAERYQVLPLEELERRRRAGKPLARCVALTFDDGFADNYELALPVFRRLGLPATLFVTTGFVGGAATPWVARVGYLMQHGAEPAAPFDLAGVRVAMATHDERRRTQARLEDLFHYMDPTRRDELLDELREAVRVESFAPVRSEMVTWEQLREMDAAGFTAGAHTVTHPFLSRVPAARVREELAESKREIEAALGRRVAAFAYPNGRADDFDASVVGAVRDAGFDLACTTVFGSSTWAADPFTLPRVSLYAKSRAEAAVHLERAYYQR